MVLLCRWMHLLGISFAKSEPCLVREHGNSPNIHLFLASRNLGWPSSLLRWQLLPPILTSHGIDPGIQSIYSEDNVAISSTRWSAMTDAHSSTRHISISQSCPTNMHGQIWWFFLTWFLGCRPSPTKVKARTTFLWLPSIHTLPLLSRRHNHPLNSANERIWWCMLEDAKMLAAKGLTGW